MKISTVGKECVNGQIRWSKNIISSFWHEKAIEREYGIFYAQSIMTTTLDDIRNFLITLNAREPPPQLVDWKHDSCCSHDTCALLYYITILLVLPSKIL